MILHDKNLKDLKIDSTKYINKTCKLWYSCDSCGKEVLKRKDEAERGSGLCRDCFAQKQGKALGDKFGKTQKMQGSCLDCGSIVRSQIKRCKTCGDRFASERNIGENNPAWSGRNQCKCGKKKSTGALQCRICSFASGLRSGENNGKFVSENRDYWLDCKRARSTMSGTMNNACKAGNFKKNYRKTKDLLGYTWQDFKKHMESKFQDGMTWTNHGKWHIDHIVPVKWFINNRCFDIKVVNALTNLQPLWAVENIRKSDKVNEETINSFLKKINEQTND